MIVLDTNVVSELMNLRPDRVVLAWAAAQPRSDLVTTSVTKAEIFYGIAILPPGRRKQVLAEAATRIFATSFADRVLPFDADAAERYGEIGSMRRRAGQPISVLDAQIAAIALTAGASVATRDVSGFEGCGVVVIDPWTAV